MESYIGEIIAIGFNWAPADWCMCDGRLLQISQYQALYTLLGTTYGGDGVTTFGIPDLRGHVVIGYGTTKNNITYTLGQKGGSMTQTLTSANLATHAHAISSAPQWPINTDNGTQANAAGNYLAPSSNFNIYTTSSPAGTYYGAGINGTSSTFAGGATPIPVVDPYMVCNYVICLNGIYPIHP